MRIRFNYFTAFFLFFLTSQIYAVGIGDIYKSDLGATYEVEQYLGQGAFGTVWEIRDLKTQEHFAGKFFSNRTPKTSTLDAYGRIADLQAKGLLNNILRVYTPEVFSLTKSKKGDTVVARSELAKSNVETLQKKNFLITNQVLELERAERVLHAYQLMHSVLRGILELKKAGLNHHDLNPRNILAMNTGYKIGDLDEVRDHGVAPRNKGWEDQSGPLEYDLPDFDYEDDNTSDMHQLGNALYTLLFGESRLQHLLNVNPQYQNVVQMRAALNTLKSLREFDVALSEEINEVKFKLFPNNFYGRSRALNLEQVFEFLEASLKLDFEHRVDALARLPFLKDFKLDHWKLETSNELDPPTEPVSKRGWCIHTLAHIR